MKMKFSVADCEIHPKNIALRLAGWSDSHSNKVEANALLQEKKDVSTGLKGQTCIKLFGVSDMLQKRPIYSS